MQNIVDIYVVYQLVKKLTTPFVDTPAFKLGIIDKHGNVLRPRKTLKTQDELDAWTWLDVMLNNIKRLLVKVPGGQQQIFTYAAAYFMLREPIKKLRESVALDEQRLHEHFTGSTFHPYLQEAVQFVEDGLAAPTNAAGSGAVAGIGVGPQGQPGVQVPDQFAGCKVFGVDSDTFKRCRMGKRRYSKYESYVGTGPVGEEIKTYGKKHRKKGIILMDTVTGSMLYLRRPMSSQMY